MHLFRFPDGRRSTTSRTSRRPSAQSFAVSTGSPGISAAFDTRPPAVLRIGAAIKSAILGSPRLSKEDLLWQELEQISVDQLQLALALSLDSAAVEARCRRARPLPAQRLALPGADHLLAELVGVACGAERAQESAAALGRLSSGEEATVDVLRHVADSLYKGHGGEIDDSTAAPAEAAAHVPRTSHAASVAAAATEHAAVDGALAQAESVSLDCASFLSIDRPTRPSSDTNSQTARTSHITHALIIRPRCRHILECRASSSVA
jgi:hypothetical protein